MTVTVAIPVPPPGGFTAEQYEALNIEYRHAELIDGRIVVNGAPLFWHQRVVLSLANVLQACASPDVVAMQQAVRLSDDTELKSDVMVIDAEAVDFDVRSFAAAVVRLVVEVVSPGNAKNDRRRSRSDMPARGFPISGWLNAMGSCRWCIPMSGIPLPTYMCPPVSIGTD